MKLLYRFSMFCCAVIFSVSAALAAEGHVAPTGSKKPRIELGTSAVFAPDGALLAVSKQGDHLLLSRSADEGANWQPPVVINADPEPVSASGDNRPKIAVARDGSIYVAWTRAMAKPYTGEIRFARSDDGKTFSPPITVHQDRSEITHAFESMVVAGDGRVALAWIDKRDLAAAKANKLGYRGAAIYFTFSSDGGRSFQPEQKIADHACECCRIASTVDETGAPLFMWRHVFEPNERDHALVRIDDKGMPGEVMRATFDKWRLDGCPHHGPSIVVDGGGQRHAVWFNHQNGEGRVFYGRLERATNGIAVANQRVIGSLRAERADLSVSGPRVSVIWKEFDGEHTHLFADISEDGGLTFKTTELATSAGASDQPRSLLRGEAFYAFWRSEREGLRVFRLP